MAAAAGKPMSRPSQSVMDSNMDNGGGFHSVIKSCGLIKSALDCWRESHRLSVSAWSAWVVGAESRKTDRVNVGEAGSTLVAWGGCDDFGDDHVCSVPLVAIDRSTAADGQARRVCADALCRACAHSSGRGGRGRDWPVPPVQQHTTGDWAVADTATDPDTDEPHGPSTRRGADRVFVRSPPSPSSGAGGGRRAPGRNDCIGRV